jgi:hypothetical protein
MVFVKDPEWYLTNQNTPDKIYSNLIFLVIGLYYIYNNNLMLGISFISLFVGSTTFHIWTRKETLFLDRLTMILVFSFFFNLFYPAISPQIFILLGLLTIAIWYKTEELLYYFIYQLFGLILFISYYPMNLYKKLVICIFYIGVSYSQLLEQGKYHYLKHLGLGLLSLFIYR